MPRAAPRGHRVRAASLPRAAPERRFRRQAKSARPGVAANEAASTLGPLELLRRQRRWSGPEEAEPRAASRTYREARGRAD